MRAYLEIARRGFRRYSTYRAATVAGVFTNTVFGFMKCYIMTTVFVGAATVGGYTPEDTLTYVWLTQALIATVFIWGWVDLGERITSGEIASDLQRPIDIEWYLLSIDLGRAVYHALARGLAPFLLGAMFFDLRLPREPWTVVVFVAAVALAVVVSFAWRFMANATAFWLLDYRGPLVVGMIVINVFSGFVVPLRFFPEWIRAALLLNPFAFVIQFPVDIFLEKYTAAEAFGMLAVQLGWAIVLLGAARAMLARGVNRLVIQGG